MQLINNIQQNVLKRVNICQGKLRTYDLVLSVSWTLSTMQGSEDKNTASWELDLLQSSVGSVKKR
jgi:hypothetical protein